MPVTIIPSDATSEVAAAVPAADIVVNPIPISVKPAPIPTIDIPSNANAAAKPNNAGIIGDSNAAPTPIIAIALANVTKLLTIEPTLIEPSLDNTDAKTVSDIAATNNAADPPNVPVIKYSPVANSASAIPIASQ